jgi:ParB/RepB/Spo0J family partition protein
MSGPEQLEIGQIDLRFSSLRLANPQQQRRVQASVQSEGRLREPLLVSTAVEEACWVLVDGFKRLLVARDLGMTHVPVRLMQLDPVQATVTMLLRNQARSGLSELEEGWIVSSLRREHGLKQAEIAKLVDRHQSWVSRRLQLVEELDAGLQEEVRLGLLSVSAARELAFMPRGIQLQAAQAIHEHQLTAHQSAQLAQRLREPHDPQAAREVLKDPLRYLAFGNGARRGGKNDPRLSEDANRLRRSLLAWEGACGRLTSQLLDHQDATELLVLSPVLQDVLRAGRRVIEQLETLQTSAGLHRPLSKSTPAEATSHAHA